jgi:hypothetical protein
MSDTFVAVRGGSDALPPVPSLDSLITPDALADLRELLVRHEARGTLIGISALRTLLLAELVDHIKTIGKDQKRLVDYVAPATSGSGTSQPTTSPPSAGTSGAMGTGGATGAPGTAAASSPAPGVAAARAPSRFVSDIADMLTPVVKMPVEQLRTTVDNQEKAIDKGATGIAELHTAHAVSDARLRVLEENVLRLDAAHRGLSNRVAAMDIELGETEEAVREASEPVIVVVEEGGNTDPGEPGQTTRARPMRQAATNVRKAQARKKK